MEVSFISICILIAIFLLIISLVVLYMENKMRNISNQINSIGSLLSAVSADTIRLKNLYQPNNDNINIDEKINEFMNPNAPIDAFFETTNNNIKSIPINLGGSSTNHLISISDDEESDSEDDDSDNDDNNSDDEEDSDEDGESLEDIAIQFSENKINNQGEDVLEINKLEEIEPDEHSHIIEDGISEDSDDEDDDEEDDEDDDDEVDIDENIEEFEIDSKESINEKEMEIEDISDIQNLVDAENNKKTLTMSSTLEETEIQELPSIEVVKLSTENLETFLEEGELKKLSIAKLRTLVAERNKNIESTKLKKQECIEILTNKN